mgnify:FL=1
MNIYSIKLNNIYQMKNQLKIVFMGTPTFAVGILDEILKKNYTVSAVVTVADKPAGRGQKQLKSAVKEYAEEKNLKILQPTNLKDENFLNELKNINANVFIVVAFRMLPQAVWKMPKLGTFNLHASLLPNYRGAAPINWAIINGETKTGVTTFFIDEKIDTGAIILNKEIEISTDENAGELHDKLMNLGKIAVVETLQQIENNSVQLRHQNKLDIYKTAEKLTKENTRIKWDKNGNEIINLIRGLSPYPSAYTFLKDIDKDYQVKIYTAKFSKEYHSNKKGKIIIDKKELKVAVKNGYVIVEELQFPGKKRMKTNELLNGLKLSENAYFE